MEALLYHESTSQLYLLQKRNRSLCNLEASHKQGNKPHLPRYNVIKRVIPFRRAGVRCVVLIPVRPERTAKTEGGKFQSSSIVPLRFSPLLLPPAAGPGQFCRHCVTRSFLVAVGAGPLACPWYGCFSRSDFPFLFL
jgi:hypothetical protein